MLSQARGLGLCLTLSHQHLGRLSGTAKTALLGTVRTQIVFQLQPTDARSLSTHFTPLMPDDLVGFPAYEIAVRPCVEGATLAPVTGRTLPLGVPTGDGAALARDSPSRFGRPRVEVEAALSKRLQGTNSDRHFGRDEDGGDPV